MTDILKKLLKAESKMENPVLDCENPHFHSKYASLGAVLAVVRPALRSEGLLMNGRLEATDTGEMHLVYIVSDGTETIELSRFPVPVFSNAQQLGSFLTYARRYSLCSVFNLVGEPDDDGNAAVKAEPAKKPDKWQPVRGLIDKAKRCGLTGEALNAWCAKAFPDVSKENFGEAELQTLEMYLKSFIADAGRNQQ